MRFLLIGIASLMMTSVLGQDTTIHSKAVTVNTDWKPKEFATLKHQYGLFSISTNLTSMLSIQPFNRAFTIEPEYQFSDRFSLKFPLLIGFDKSHTIGTTISQSGYYYYDTYSNDNFDANSVPQVERRPIKPEDEDLVVQVGVNPKYYFNGKSKNLFSFYGGGAFNLGLADQYRMDQYDRLDSSGYYSSWQNTYVQTWDIVDSKREYSNAEYLYFNYELLLGLDYNFSRRVTCTFEMGYASKLYGKPEPQDRVYTAIFNEDYVLNYEGQMEVYGRRTKPFRARLLLTWRF